MAAMVPAGGAEAQTRDTSMLYPDWHWTANFGVTDTNGDYGTPNNTNVLLGLTTLSLSNDSFKFSASLPYMRISGRGLLVFDANGNPIVINRRVNGPTDVRTGWGPHTQRLLHHPACRAGRLPGPCHRHHQAADRPGAAPAQHR